MPEQFRPNEEEILKMEEDKKEDAEFSEEEQTELERILCRISYKFKLEDLNDIPKKYHKAIAIEFIEEDGGRGVIENFEKFKGLDSEVVVKLLEKGRKDSIFLESEKMQGLLDKKVAMKLIELGEIGALTAIFEKIKGIDQEIVIKLIELGYGATVIYDCDFEKIQNLNYDEIVVKLIETRQGELVFSKKFEKLDLNYILTC